MISSSLAQAIYEASTWVVPVVIAVTFHEAAHGFVAHRFGDDTAWRLGRVTFNPLKHIDRFGTIILPAFLILARSPFLFGYAKPVPVDFRRHNRPRRDMVWVALAGPGTNVLLALAAATLFGLVRYLPGGSDPFVHNLHFILVEGVDAVSPTVAAWVAANLANAIVINAILCMFNMLPLPPLDGGRVAVGLLPDRFAMPLARLERFGLPIIMLLLFVLPWIGERLGHNLNLLSWIVGVPAEALIRLILVLTGHGG